MTSARKLALAAGATAAVIFGAIVAFGTPWRSQPEPPPMPTPAPQPSAAVVPTAAHIAEMKTFTDALWPEAQAKGVSEDIFQRAVRGLSPDDDIAALNASQPEHVKTAGDYLNLLVSETRITNGRAKLAEHADLFARIEQRFGVDKHVVLAIWGIESAYGTSMGERNVIRSLATLAMTDQRRSAFWKSELLAALTILQRGDITASAMTGSWAGAMGHTQFMPTTYLAHAADLDGDGKRDIWGPPGDALASAANYLKVSGWATGQPAAVEVALPAGFDFALSAPNVTKPWADWLAIGLKPSRALVGAAPTGSFSLIIPAGHTGPAFLTGPNFRAILKYNRAVPYALAVGHLAERIAGGVAFVTPWPADDKALSKSDREDLQTRLTALGHDIGPIDGIIGSGTRAAIRAFQKSEALPEDGHPSGTLLERLRAAKPKAP